MNSSEWIVLLTRSSLNLPLSEIRRNKQKKKKKKITRGYYLLNRLPYSEHRGPAHTGLFLAKMAKK